MEESFRSGAEVKIFGERNTGTNALKALIESNSLTKVCPSVAKEVDPQFNLKMTLLGCTPRRYRTRLREAYIDNLFRNANPRLAWKHAATRFGEIENLDGCPVILMTRHPASWLLGLHKHPYHALTATGGPFAAFLQTRWRLVKRDNLAEASLLPAQLWNAKSRSHLSLAEALARKNMSFRIVKFEDFVVDQAAVFRDLKGVLSKPAVAPSIITRSTKERDKSVDYYRDYYGKQKWLDEVSQECAEIINRSIDWSIARDLNYA